MKYPHEILELSRSPGVLPEDVAGCRCRDACLYLSKNDWDRRSMAQRELVGGEHGFVRMFGMFAMFPNDFNIYIYSLI